MFKTTRLITNRANRFVKIEMSAHFHDVMSSEKVTNIQKDLECNPTLKCANKKAQQCQY